MTAISLWQPWASLWALGVKIHETRHWWTEHRGPLLVHATQKLCRDIDAELEAIVAAHCGGDWHLTLPRGALVGVCEIDACIPTERCTTTATDRICGNFSAGRYAWRARQAYRFEVPIPFQGRQTFFDVPVDLVMPALCGGSIAAPAPAAIAMQASLF
jgi:hypothetical protein